MNAIMTTFASFQQRPFSSTASLIGDALGSAASATQAAVAAVPAVSGALANGVRSSIPGLPAGGSLNPLPPMPEITMPEITLPSLPSLPQVDIPLPDMPEVHVPVMSVSTKNIGMPFGEVFGLKEGKSLAPEINVRWKSVKADDILDAMGLDDDEAEFRDLAKALDLDNLRKEFFKYAGPDERMDEEEFKLFTRKQKLSEAVSESLWRNLDVDGNGIVDADEFTMALETMTKARAWLRFCPTCDFANECPYCVECADCRECTPERFCPRHWNDHPDRKRYLTGE